MFAQGDIRSGHLDDLPEYAGGVAVPGLRVDVDAPV